MSGKKYYVNEWQLRRLGMLFDELENETPDMIANELKAVLDDIKAQEAMIMSIDNMLYLKESFIEYRDGIQTLIDEIDEELKIAGVQEGEENGR